MSLKYIEQGSMGDHDGPLCPNFSDPLHALAVKIQNAMYDVMDKDEDGESPEDQYKLYRAADKAAPSYMQLYLAESSPSILGQGSSHARAGVYIEAWFFKCPTCDLMIPATGIRRNNG